MLAVAWRGLHLSFNLCRPEVTMGSLSPFLQGSCVLCKTSVYPFALRETADLEKWALASPDRWRSRTCDRQASANRSRLQPYRGHSGQIMLVISPCVMPPRAPPCTQTYGPGCSLPMAFLPGPLARQPHDYPGRYQFLRRSPRLRLPLPRAAGRAS